MKIEDKFILMTPKEFRKWMGEQEINRSVNMIQNHHTWKPNYNDFQLDNHFKLLRGMRRSHLERGFDDIAQNITTFPDGMIAVCRPLTKIPAGIKGANTGGICIEHIGNFDLQGDTISAKHKNCIVRLNAILCDKFGLKPDENSIVYHHWWDLNSGKRRNGDGVTKSCPGTNFFGGNQLENAKKNFIPLVAKALEMIDDSFDAADAVNIAAQIPKNDPNKEAEARAKFLIAYNSSTVSENARKLQVFLNQFDGIKLKEDGKAGRNTSDAAKKVLGNYLVGDKRN